MDMTDILVKDDAATPKEWTLKPISDSPASVWRASDAALPIEAQPRLTVSEDAVKSGGLKLTAKLEMPILEILGASGTSLGYVAAPKVAHVPTAILSMFVDRRSTIADRANLLKMMLGVLQGASATTGTGILTNTAAGGAFASSTKPLVQFFTEIIRPT